MRRPHSWLSFALVPALLGCSKAPPGGQSDQEPHETAPPAATAAPKVVPNADPRPTTAVMVRNLAVDGRPADAAVRKTVELGIPRWRECVAARKLSDGGLVGTLEYEIQVDDQGQATKVSSAGGTLSSPALSNCIIASTFYSLTLDSIERSSTVTVELSFESAK